MDGLEATRHIRQNPKFQHVSQVPVIALTAYAMVGDQEHFLESGMSGYIAKPLVFENLRAVLDKCVRKPQA